MLGIKANRVRLPLDIVNFLVALREVYLLLLFDYYSFVNQQQLRSNVFVLN